MQVPARLRQDGHVTPARRRRNHEHAVTDVAKAKANQLVGVFENMVNVPLLTT